IMGIIGGVLTYPAIVTMASGKATSTLLGMGINANFFGLPVKKPPTAAPILAVTKARPYFKLIPYMAGSVTPQKAEIVAGQASS
ncbi:hypothetical protein WP50_35870, partial [Lactiplantibacillus plantarum]